jgi:hypothetical protein
MDRSASIAENPYIVRPKESGSRPATPFKTPAKNARFRCIRLDPVKNSVLVFTCQRSMLLNWTILP